MALSLILFFTQFVSATPDNISASLCSVIADELKLNPAVCVQATVAQIEVGPGAIANACRTKCNESTPNNESATNLCLDGCRREQIRDTSALRNAIAGIEKGFRTCPECQECGTTPRLTDVAASNAQLCSLLNVELDLPPGCPNMTAEDFKAAPMKRKEECSVRCRKYNYNNSLIEEKCELKCKDALISDTAAIQYAPAGFETARRNCPVCPTRYCDKDPSGVEQ